MNAKHQKLDEPVKRELISEVWFDSAGRIVKQKDTGRRGYSISEYKPNGDLKRTVQLSDSGEVLAESKPLHDRRGRNVGGMQKSRRTKRATKGRHVLPKDFRADQTSASRYTRQWYDPVGRAIASADYGFVESDADPISDYIPQSSETVRVSRTIYDPATGRALGYIDSESHETRSEVDAMGRTVKTIINFKSGGVFTPERPDENITTEMRYDIAGNLVWQRDPAGNVTQQVYDKLGKLVATVAPNGDRTTFEYDLDGQIIAETAPMGRTTRFEYDSQGRRVKTILPKPNENSEHPVQQTVYNELGQVEYQIDPLGNTTRFEYDEMGRTVRQIDANGGMTAFEYDDEGQLLSLTDPVGNTTRYEYDELGRVEKETNELGKSRLFEYTPSGGLLEKTDRNGRVTAFKYTRFGQVAEERWLTGKRTTGRICFDYDKSGRLTKVSDSSGIFEYEYDTLSRMNAEVTALAGLKPKISLQSTFDVLGRRISQTALIGQREDYTTRWTYNNLGQVDTISYGSPSIEPKQAVYSYDKAGAKGGVTVSSGGNDVYRSELAYDDTGRLEGIHYVNPATKTLARYGLTWDPASRITAMNLDGEPARYGYDATSQLTSATYGNLPAEAYEYDANGNRKDFETGKNNQLTFDGESRYTYDDEGNRITKGKTRYFWDHRNRLVKVVTSKKTVEYQYDYRNRLTRRNDEFFVHDGWQIVLALKNGKVVDRYLWGARQDELLCENDKIVLTDHLGTIRKTIGKDGETVSELTYNAFGKLISGKGKMPRFRYTGKLFDDETGLQWNVNRWYDSQVGRWTSEDPINHRRSEVNLVRYNSNSPLDHLDMLGLWKLAIENGRHIVTAESGDTFEKLVKLINETGTASLTSQNKVCIRPYPNGLSNKIVEKMKTNWKKEKPYCDGKYDATSLFNAIPSPEQTGGNFSIGLDESAPDHRNRGYIADAGAFYHSSPITTATELAVRIRQLASNGDTPLRSLVLVGHSKAGSLYIGGFNNGGAFSFDHLHSTQPGFVLSTPFEWMNWDWAVNMDKALPGGCWFSTTVHIRLVGCYTEYMADQVARKLVRRGGVVFGTEHATAVFEEDGKKKMAFFVGPNDNNLSRPRYETPAEYHGDRRWAAFDGRN